MVAPTKNIDLQNNRLLITNIPRLLKLQGIIADYTPSLFAKY